ncbi:MAG TPA: hypothetical protein PLE19_23660 [Planctomycetota bacterium]|nr:hypothetical protein [Planctomycetota bacterium]HRR82664.1 hypothetical protein [Planctomycetota bacterium]HRT96765.1 hypothetical protein [Planctomycetota bacterium]
MNVSLTTLALRRSGTRGYTSATRASHPAILAEDTATQRLLHCTVVVLLALAFAVAANGPVLAANPLPPGTSLFKPGTVPPLGPPNYSTTLPSYFVAGNIVGGPMASAYAPLTPDIAGVLTSTVYRDPATGFLGFRYHFTSTGASDLIRATIAGASWLGVTITNAGADGSGSSTAGTVAPFWTDGDPNFIQRNPVVFGDGLTIQWRALSRGTALRAGDSSSSIFIETNWETFQTVAVGLLDSGAVSTAQAFAPGPINPSLDIEKHTNGQDADVAPGPLIAVGAPVLWEYIVTNTGDVTLTNITVTDDVLGVIGVIPSLAPGASQTLSANGVAVGGQYANVGTAVGYPPVGDPVSDTDPSHYLGGGVVSFGRVTIEKSGGELLGNSRTIGFWKNNIQKHMAGKTRGIQVSYADLASWLVAVEGFYLPDPFVLGATDAQRLQNAYNILNYSGSNMASKTRRQLLATELNLLSGTFALDDVAAHEALCKLAEDALNTVGADLAFIHNLLDLANNAGENGGYPGPLTCGNTVLYTITITATGLPNPKDIVVKDCLDTSLMFLVADGGGQYSAATHCVKWNVTLPAGDSVKVLHIWANLLALPAGDAAQCPPEWTCSNVLELPVATKKGVLLEVGLRNTACFKEVVAE